MMLTKCYCVVYHVADFAADGEFICHQDTYRDHNNALLVAKDLAKCFDIVDDVYVIDGLTGEVLNTILKDEPQEDTTKEGDIPTDNTEKNNAPTPVDTYKDKNGNTWYSAGNGKWKFDCTNRYCSDCPYYDEEYGCTVEEPLYEEDRNYQVALVHERMRTKVRETDENNTSTNTAKKDDAPISSGIFEDGTGGVWQLIEDNKWNYQCLGVACSDCAYCDENHCFARDPMTEEERDKLIKSAKAGIKK